MIKVEKPRQIFDGAALTKRLDEVVSWSGYGPKTHNEIHGFYKEALKAGHNEIRRRFEEDSCPASISTYYQSWLMDQVITHLYDFTLGSVYPMANPTTGEQFSLMATGGYGRQEMAPYSDIDLMFLVPYKVTPHTEQVVEFMLYFLWDLGLTVGHSTRSLDEAMRLANEDLSIRTNLLESRCICGDKALFKVFWKRYIHEVVEEGQIVFVDGKLAEREARHERMGDTRYVLEPNVKEGKGGLRDLQTLFWITKYLYQITDMAALVEQNVFTKQDVKVFEKASNFLWTVRCNLHYLAGREEDRLTFDVQLDVGRRMGYQDHAGTRGVERFMKHYFLMAKDVGDLSRILCAVLEEQHKKKRRFFQMPSLPFGLNTVDGFSLENGRLTLPSAKEFKADPIKLVSLFLTALNRDIDIHPRTLRWVRQSLPLINHDLRNDPEANAAFVDILTSKRNPEKMLMTMNEAGVFGRFIPDFGRVVAQMQYDMYHVYTVDEHTIRALGILHRIDTGELKEDHPVSSLIIAEVQSRRVLYVAVLLHDIAKGRKGDHAVLGAEIALQLCPRLGFSEWETETVAWLVHEHLLMSRLAFKRDLDDPETVARFAETVQSPERLRLLLILTVADIRAVGPKVWNAWKAELLRELYFKTQEVLSGVLPADRRVRRIESEKAELRGRLKDYESDWVESFLERGRDSYWVSFDADTHMRHASIVWDAEQNDKTLSVRSTVATGKDVTEIIVYAPDHPGLFASIAGVMSLSQASIVDAKIATMADGTAIDTFWIQDEKGKAYAETRRLDRLKSRILSALQGDIKLDDEIAKVQKTIIPSRQQVFQVPPRVLIDNTISSDATVLEINGRDRLGFLLDLTVAISKLGLQITSAHISTYGERVVDVFYVKDMFGLKITSDSKIEKIRGSLLDAIAPEQAKKAEKVSA